jgi:hypothetical protein
MNKLRIMLNNRKHFLVSAALAAVLVLVAGGAKALIPPTVRCVPSLSVNPSCAVAYPTISAALGAPAQPGDTIFVGPGTYNESVTIAVGPILLLGAQAGNDARVGRHDPTKESIVNATGQGNPPFVVNANYVVIDGFTVTGGTLPGSPTHLPGGIFVGSVAGGYYWAQVLNNIIEKNGPGVYLYGAPSSPPPAPSPSALIEHNLFSDNNYGTGTWNGFAIVTQSGALPPLITENAFTANKMTAMVFLGSVNVTVTNNTSENDGAFVVLVGTNQCLFSHNQGKNFGRKGVLPVVVSSHTIYADAAVDIGPANSSLLISDNVLERGEAPISNGIAFTTAFAATPYGTTANFDVNVRNNSIKGFPGNGIVAEEQTGGTVYGSWIVGNEVWDNGRDGIFIGANNYNISFFDNQAEGNHTLDCNDASTGIGTLGTANVWFNNIGTSSSPSGLCTPGRWHPDDLR